MLRLTVACLLASSVSAFTAVHTGIRSAAAVRPKLNAQMALEPELQSIADLPTSLLAAAGPPVRMGLKSPGDELLDEFVSLFPIIFVGTLFGAFAFQYAKKLLEDLELDITLPDPENGGQILLYGFWASPALIIAAVFAKEAGAPIPSPEAVLSPVTFVINTGAGLLAKTSMDGWNLIAPVIGLGDAALRY